MLEHMSPCASLKSFAMSDGEDAETTWDWDIPQTLSLIPFLIVQISMVVFLVRHGRKEKSFRQAFYVFFIAVTLVDCTMVVVVSSGNRTWFAKKIGWRDQGSVIPISSNRAPRAIFLKLKFCKIFVF